MAGSSNSGLSSIASRSNMLNSWYFNLHFGLYLIYKSYTLSGGSTTRFLDSYFADYLALPVLLSLTVELLSVIKKGEHKLSFLQILFAVVYTSWFMEYFAPKWSAYAVADWRDALAYGLGGLSFYFAQRIFKAT